ncbi:hypothetical protein QBC34DRAFT_400289 [Podospora aff. communis PSN243]|uniref:Secreted protein n=1 Tax=Podospora aff. communis PSN243 TaxID=3040156 RepID=A0AAV9GW38_9PEZI|nr:hypothetical protein QBC34DRAFT_400289 [Podospora aff. communis PSN243]
MYVLLFLHWVSLTTSKSRHFLTSRLWLGNEEHRMRPPSVAAHSRVSFYKLCWCRRAVRGMLETSWPTFLEAS